MPIPMSILTTNRFFPEREDSVVKKKKNRRFEPGKKSNGLGNGKDLEDGKYEEIEDTIRNVLCTKRIQL